MILKVNDYKFYCIETPGHTAGHMCLYEPEKKILISGDHLLFDISPNVSQWFEDSNPLDDYIQSLDKIYNLDVELVLPGHKAVFKNNKERVQELKSHHQIRIDEVLSILKNRDMDAYQVASEMEWDIPFKNWDLFPARG